MKLHDYNTGLDKDIEIIIEDNSLYVLIPVKMFYYSELQEITAWINLHGQVEKITFNDNNIQSVPDDLNLNSFYSSSQRLIRHVLNWIHINYKLLEAFKEGKINEKLFKKIIIMDEEKFVIWKKIIFKIALINYRYSTENKERSHLMTRSAFKKLMIGIMIFMVSMIFIIASVTVISPTQRGVKITLGKAGDTVLQPGIAFKAPFAQSVKKYDLSPKQLEMSFTMGQDAAVTLDMQSVACNMVVYWTYDETRILDIVNGYTDSSIKNLVKDNTLGAIKEVIGKYSIYDVIEKQDEVATKVLASLVTRLNKYPASINTLTINNWDWSQEFDAQIANTMKMAQQVKVAQQELEVTKQQAQKQVAEANAAKEKAEIEAKMKVTIAEQEALAREKEAEGKANATKIAAEAEAYAREIAGKAEASYYQSLIPYREIIEATRNLDINEVRAENWDGREVSQYIPLTANGVMVTI